MYLQYQLIDRHDTFQTRWFYRNVWWWSIFRTNHPFYVLQFALYCF